MAVTASERRCHSLPLRKAIPNNRGLSILRLGLSHLTVIRTHILFDHLLSSVEAIIKEKLELVNQFFQDCTFDVPGH